MYQQSATEQLSVDSMENCSNSSNSTGNGMVRGDFEAFGFLILFMRGLSLSLNAPTIIACALHGLYIPCQSPQDILDYRTGIWNSD